MRSIRGGTLGWNIEIYSTPKNQFDWFVSRAYVIGERAKRVRHTLLLPIEKMFRRKYVQTTMRMLTILREAYARASTRSLFAVREYEYNYEKLA